MRPPLLPIVLGMLLIVPSVARAQCRFPAASTEHALTYRFQPGQTLGRVSVYNGQPDRLATFTIHTDAGDQPIAFYPRGKAIPGWQYHLDQSGSCEANSVK